jgi:hypothetical protein
VHHVPKRSLEDIILKVWTYNFWLYPGK